MKFALFDWSTRLSLLENYVFLPTLNETDNFSSLLNKIIFTRDKLSQYQIKFVHNDITSNRAFKFVFVRKCSIFFTVTWI